MRTLFKYLLTLLFLFFSLLYYLFNSTSGNEYFNSYLSKYLSTKSKNEIVIDSLDASDYPIIEVMMKINQNSMVLRGEISYGYSDGFGIKGVISEFGGNLYFDYNEKKNEILFTLEKISLEKILKRFSYPIRMTANLFGTIIYDTKNEIVIFDNQLKELRLINNRVTNMVFLATQIDMTQYLYDKSTFKGYYYKNLLSGDFKIDSDKEHIYFKQLRVSSKTKEITSYFDIKMEGQEVFGTVNGTTSDPSFTVDVSKLIKHQVDKNFNKFDVEVNELSDKAKSLFNTFF